MKIYKNIIMGLLSFLFGCSDSSPYQEIKGKWCYNDLVMTRQPGENFQPLNDVFARDDEGAFYRDSPIEGSDGKSFVALSKNYGKDQNKVYYCDTYRKGQEYFTVKYNSVKILPEADAGTFVFMTLGYAKDRNHVYYEGKSFSVADPASYQLLENGFSADHKKVYYHRVEIAGADARSFQTLDSHYSKDTQEVYFSEIYYDADKGPIPMSKVIPGADAATFSLLENVTEEADARDKLYYYKEGVKHK